MHTDVNPMLVPALTVPASATFVIDRLGQFTVMEAEACTELALVADAVRCSGTTCSSRMSSGS